jgi:tripartite-type tricarboxylate transporter receptor subunit TctC
MKHVFGGLALAFATMHAPCTQAQTYPDRPIKLLVPLAAASAVDVVARVVGEKMGDALGQRLYVENMPGAAGRIGMRAAAHAAPDGYTVLVANDSVLTMIPNMAADAGYDPVKEFAPVTQLVRIPLGLIAHPSFPARDVGELIAQARAKPNAVTYASGGPGSPQHVAMELFVRTTGVQMTHVPYRGATQAVNEIVAGHVPIGFTGMSSVFGLLPENRVRLLAVSTPSRVAQVPDVPTVAEAGVPGFDFVAWCALLVPAGTPADVIAKLNAAAVKALADPAVTRKLLDLGFEIGGTTAGDLDALMRREFSRMGDLIRSANIRE